MKRIVAVVFETVWGALRERGLLRCLPPTLLSFVLMLSPTAYARELQWTFDPALGNADSSPAVADLNGDGKDDLVVTTAAGMVVAIDNEGRQIWMSGVQIPISIAPTVVKRSERTSRA